MMRGKRTKEINETFLTLNKSRSYFLIVWFIEGVYVSYLNVILFSVAFFHRRLYKVNNVFWFLYSIQLKDSSLLLIIMSCIVFIDSGIYYKYGKSDS